MGLRGNYHLLQKGQASVLSTGVENLRKKEPCLVSFIFSFEGLTFGKCSLLVSEYRPQAWEPENPVVELLIICSECSHEITRNIGF